MSDEPNIKSDGAPHRAPTARDVAASVVHRALHQQAYVSEALDEELARSTLDVRDRALCTEISYGVVRLRIALDARLSQLAKKGVARGDPLCQAHLLVAAYQLLCLDRVPAFAAINEAVTSIRRLRGQRVAGFANAVLRKLSSQAQPLALEEALAASVAPWLMTELTRSVGREGALSLLGATGGSSHRGLCVRLTPRAESPPEWARTAEVGRVSPRALWLSPRGDLRTLPEHAAGTFVIQEEGAQWSALALGVRPGERILDACAGHGQKASLLAEQLAGTGTLVVNDVAGGKLNKLRREFQRLGLSQPGCSVEDLALGTGELSPDFDRILVDAPCTGTGTLRRRPEILTRLVPEDPQRLADQGLAIVRNAARLLRPGGRLVYVVCSVLRTECEEVAERAIGADGAGLVPAPFDAPEALALGLGEAWCHRLLPSEHGTDGYFIASLARAVH